MLLRYF